AIGVAGREKMDVMHARGYVPAAMGALAKWRAGGKLIFDIRGFMAEEDVDAGVWAEGGVLYRLTKTAEKKLVKAADGFVVVTGKAREILFPHEGKGRPVEVIPCCVDAERFRPFVEESRDDLRHNLNLEGRRALIYVGALGGWYLTNEMAELMAFAHQEDASTFSMVLTQSPP